jgi:molybdopterin synthase sulfur carrier subunit
MPKVTVRIPTPLRKMTSGQAEVEIEATTVEELIDNLDQAYAGTRDRLADENGDVRRFVNLFVNDEDIRFLQGKDTRLEDGDAVSIVPAIAGGTP